MALFRRKLHRKKRRRFGRRGLIFLLFLVVFSFFFIIVPVMSIRNKGKALVVTARQVKAAFKQNDIDLVKNNLSQLTAQFDSFHSEAKKIYWLRFVPIAGFYVSDFRNGVEASDNLLKAGVITVDTMAPYADLIGFKKGATFAEKSADDRLQTAVLTLDKVVGKVDDIAVYVDAARNHIDQINENRYPGKYKTQIKLLKEQFDGPASLFVDAKPFIKKLPQILGTDTEKTYLILFQNDKELRPTGGFLTAYAIFKVKNGKFQVEKSEDIYSLDNSIRDHPKAPKEILTYHKGVFQYNIRDSNLSPDFVKSMGMFDEMYQKSSQKVAYDGIIAVDTHVLVDTLSILGDTEAGGIVFSQKTDARCDCPQVIYELLNQIDRPVSFIKENRKGLLGQLLYAIMQKALGFSPSRYWGKLSQNFIENLQDKHILVYLKDADAQKAIEAINFGGRIKDFNGDYLHINDTNFAGAKSNLYVQHTITTDTKIESDGTVHRTITMTYRNPRKQSNCSLKEGGGALGVGGLCINATLRNWLRIYTPEGSKLISFRGSETTPQTYSDLNKTVFEGFMQVKPLGKASVIIEYELPFKVKNLKDYRLLIQKQPGTTGHDYTISINGRKYEQFNLITDHEFKVR